jgi:hypothetical protein
VYVTLLLQFGAVDIGHNDNHDEVTSSLMKVLQTIRISLYKYIIVRQVDYAYKGEELEKRASTRLPSGVLPTRRRL